MTALAPIALFIYRRPEHTRRTIESLRANPEFAGSPVVIYCDGAKTPDAQQGVTEARRIARALVPQARFVERDQNLGLKRSIIDGVGELVREHGRVIVVEDDLEVAPTFLAYMNAALDRYATDDRVMQISGYQFPIDPPLDVGAAFLPFPTSLGWATWARAWAHFDEHATGYAALVHDPDARRRFDLDGSYPYFAMLERQLRGELDSWAILWVLSVFNRNGLVLHPGRSLVRNIGDDGTGTHDRPGARIDATVRDAALPSLPEVALDTATQRRVYAFLADEQSRSARDRMKYFAARWTRKALSNRHVPPAIRMAGNSLLARVTGSATDTGAQDLDLYWDPQMAEILDTWGTGTAWNEIQLLLANVRGRVLDIACGTGKVMTLLAPYPALELHGFDISDFLIGKALARGIAPDRLKVADATATPYADNAFDYGYSIGSLEHFTEDGILKFVREAYRITRHATFHMIPTSRSGRDEGWMKTHQSFHNNSVAWWLARYRSAYATVHVLDSAWQDKISVGKWFVCVKEEPR